ncbi:MAG: LemA family protein [bacterium]|nr:LemA family protein [bacterium]
MLLLILLVIVVAIVLWVVITYNGFIRLKNNTDEAWSDIDVQLKRRHDLIPNLIETVKGYVAHESGVLTAVTEARTKAMQSGSQEDQAKAENALTGTLKSLFAVAENYPDLKANTNFLELQRELSDTENKIQASRRFYNGNVRDMNSAMQVFPGNFIASTFNFKQRAFFELDDVAEKEVPQVKF